MHACRPLLLLILLLSSVQMCAAVSPPRAMVEQFCIECHDADTRKGEIDLESLLRDEIESHTATWEQVVKQMDGMQMPPAGKRQPDETTRQAAIALLIQSLDAEAARHPTPGKAPTLRRLTRTEYRNAVRDLLAVDFDARAFFPIDEISNGFDNITVGDLPPSLLDRYITAAQKIARAAIGREDGPQILAVRVRPDITQEYRVEGLPFGTRGGVMIAHTFNQEGEYDVQVRLTRDRNEQVEGMHGPHQVVVLLDRAPMAEFTVKPAKDKDYEKIDAHLKTRMHISSGSHKLGVTFPEDGASVLERLRQPYKASFNLHRHPRLSPAVYQVTITGPFNAKGPGDTPSRRMVFGDDGSKDARRILGSLLRRAWRREITEADLARMLTIVDAADDFESGIESAIAAILVSREFLFRTEIAPSETLQRIADVELASRLSFFLWSSLPDETLLAAALHGGLDAEAQARRMLRDSRASALVDNFADQWLYLRNLESITPDARLFPDFDHNLRESLRTETSHLVQDVIEHDRSVLDLLRTDRTWLDERLAAHYGIPHIYGSRFREVAAEPGWQRGGLLRQGSILTLTSYATRTSPVIRGHWVLKNILGSPPPPPPPNVPALDGVIPESLPVRERLALHRQNAACATCHATMDPVGFALENYDAIGRWREVANGQMIDATGNMPDGGRCKGIAGLEDWMLKKPDKFAATLTEKLMTYALGRGLTPGDAPAVRQIVRRARDHDWRFSEIIAGIVTSVPFTMRGTAP